MKRPVQMVLYSFLLLILADGAVGAKMNITLQKRVHVRKTVLYLQEIARVHMDPGTVVPDLGSLEIGPAPLPGKKIIITRSRLLLLLKSRKIRARDVHFSGAEQTVILRDAQTVTARQIRRVVKQYLVKEIPWRSNEVEIGRITGPRDLLLPAGKIAWQVISQPHTDFLGTTPLQVILETAGEKKQIWVNADIRVYVPVVTARHPIARMSQIDANDVVVERRNLAGMNSDYFSSVKDIVGTRSRSFIRAGEPIRKNEVEIPPVVRRGDLVTMQVENNLFRIIARGKVLENGIPGAVIRVQNIASKKEVYGKVIDGSTVRIETW
ncbi:MAG: flagellar basal body P-ring formation protein FlgA [Deltaproteobacteria bacterium]|nr:flagellar basal body P-ring formation protein FlgA [Deltaproteobacteria bacterium]